MPSTQPLWRINYEKNAYPIRPIRTEADYQAALQLVSPYFDNEHELESDAGAYFEVMVTLIEAYEAKYDPIDPPDPVDAIKFRIEQQGLKPKDLEPMSGRPPWGPPCQTSCRSIMIAETPQRSAIYDQKSSFH